VKPLKRNKHEKKTKQLRNRSLVTHYHSKSSVAEQYRTIRTNIQFTSVDQDVKTMMVTSPLAGEGKSTTAVNLAVVFAQQGKRVLLIDADMRKPTVHYVFGINNTSGLTNVLTKQISLEEAVVQTEIQNLFLLSSGTVPPNPAELLSSRSMREVVEQVMEMYDFIIFDTPPILPVTDAQVIANQCDGTVLVVASEKTENEPALKAKELLDKAGGKLLGVVLNRRQIKGSRNDYYYG
jgi:capsular exopolysaccharide synthesis family protein